jgi:hypothetical protein
MAEHVLDSPEIGPILQGFRRCRRAERMCGETILLDRQIKDLPATALKASSQAVRWFKAFC